MEPHSGVSISQLTTEHSCGTQGERLTAVLPLSHLKEATTSRRRRSQPHLSTAQDASGEHNRKCAREGWGQCRLATTWSVRVASPSGLRTSLGALPTPRGIVGSSRVAGRSLVGVVDGGWGHSPGRVTLIWCSTAQACMARARVRQAP